MGYLNFVDFYPGLFYLKNTSIYMEESFYDNKNSKYDLNTPSIIYSEIKSEYFIIEKCQFLNTINELNGGVFLYLY